MTRHETARPRPLQVYCPLLDFSWRHPLIASACIDGPDFLWHWSGDLPLKGAHHAALVHSVPLRLPAGLPAAFHLEEARSIYWFRSSRATEGGAWADPALKAECEARLAQFPVILTHLKHTADNLHRLVGAELAARVRHVPLGIALPPYVPRAAETFRFLFTASYHGQGTGFARRGGREAILAFEHLRRAFDPGQVTLTIVAPGLKLGGNLDGIELVGEAGIGRRLGDHEIGPLFDRCDAWLCPSLDLHAHSLLRAMAHGCVPIVSDAPGYGEFVIDGRTGIVVPGRLGLDCWIDPQNGLIQSVDPAPAPRDDYVARLAGAMFRAATGEGPKPEFIRAHVTRQHPIGRWRRAFEQAVDTAYAQREEMAA